MFTEEQMKDGFKRMMKEELEVKTENLKRNETDVSRRKAFVRMMRGGKKRKK